MWWLPERLKLVQKQGLRDETPENQGYQWFLNVLWRKVGQIQGQGEKVGQKEG